VPVSSLTSHSITSACKLIDIVQTININVMCKYRINKTLLNYH
jgi:hypothetical protein